MIQFFKKLLHWREVLCSFQNSESMRNKTADGGTFAHPQYKIFDGGGAHGNVFMERVGQLGM